MFTSFAARRASALLLTVCATTAPLAIATDVNFKYLGRYNNASDFLAFPDELTGIEAIGDDLALISSNTGITLVSFNEYTLAGTEARRGRLFGLDVRSTYTRGNVIFANIRQGGLAVITLNRTTGALDVLRQLEEPGVHYEFMAFSGAYLYVPAHAYGLRIFDVRNPFDPRLVGSIGAGEGLVDAWAVEVVGNIAYVADGGAGLKRVDVSDPANPVVLDGETLATAVGTAEDILVADGHVYTANMGGGVCFYPNGDLSQRVVYKTPVAAKGLARAGDFLGVADTAGIYAFHIAPDGTLSEAAREYAQRGRDRAFVRIWYGITNWGTDAFVTAAWYTSDIFQLVDPATDDQPDLDASTNRVRLTAGPDSVDITLRNDGSGPLTVTDIASSNPHFVVAAATTSPTLQPDETFTFTVDYNGGQPGEAKINVFSNDPDESPLPIQVFGATEHLDPGEPARDFQTQSWHFDHATRTFTTDTFDLAAHRGKIVYFAIYGSWCPACVPVVADLQHTVFKEFADEPRVVTALLNEAEDARTFKQLWRNVYLRGQHWWSPSTADFSGDYRQPLTGMPFGRNFIIGPDGTVEVAVFGHNPAKLISQIYALLAELSPTGDVNCDGVVSTFDIDAFILALTSADDYAAAYPYCNHQLADCNGDESVDMTDIDCFVELLSTAP